MDDAIAFMKDLDSRFRNVSGLSDRRHYSIFYSRLCPSPVMVIGIKPGGATDGTHQLASQTFYEGWEHEYVDMNYRIAAVMRPTLMAALDITDVDELRRVPKTNTFFHRAVGTDDFSSAEYRANARQCAPFLDEMIAYVAPRAIILEGMGARDNLVGHLCASVEPIEGETVNGMRFGRLSPFFRKDVARLKSSDRAVMLLTVGHPSRFGGLADWPKAVAALHRNLGRGFSAGPTAGPTPCLVPAPSSAPPLARAPVETSVDRPPQERPRQTPASRDTIYEAVRKPPSNFGYQPIHDFWNELSKRGPSTIEAMHQHMLSLGWQRPSGKPLTYEVMRTDMVSMAKNGFIRRLGK
ncbi:MAG: hypothetical protein RLO08_13940 [Parvibaculaceae bacterium]